ncbi:MAG TPA: lysylphosphatidylglycerol synthase domain-containing protein [bacterium]|nr:lysylphosphatidylglycerol synthase domain-containing protein [bacterium]
MKQLLTFFKKAFPWLVAAAIFAWLFHRYPPANIYNAMKYVNIPLFFTVAVLYFFVMFVIDTFSISLVLSRFGNPEGVRELLPARGATYLFMIFNYAAAQAAFAFYQYRKHGIPISKMLGIFGIVVVVDLLLLATLAFSTTFLTSWPFEVAGMNIAQFVRIFTVAGVGGLVALILVANAAADLSFVKRLRKFKLVDLLATTGISDYAYVAFARLPVHAFIMLGMYVAIWAFDAHVPFLKILANIPIIFFIGSLPITPGGLGTSNAALVELLKPFVEAPAITAGGVSPGDLLFSFSLAWMFSNYVMKAATGSMCLRFVSRELFRPTPETSAPKAEEESVKIGGNI